MQKCILNCKTLYIPLLFISLLSFGAHKQTYDAAHHSMDESKSEYMLSSQDWDGTMTRACPCPTTINGGPPFVVCNLLTNTVTTDQLVVHGSACFQSPIQFCSGVSGLPLSPLEGLWIVGELSSIPGPGFTTLQDVNRTRSFDCTGAIINLRFNKITDDPADAFTLLKTIRECDVLRLTQIGLNGTCPVSIVETQAATGVTGCGDVFVVPVFDVSGLLDIYSNLGEAISLLNFGPPSVASPTAPGTACPCWTKLICPELDTQCILTNFNSGILITSQEFNSLTGYNLLFSTLNKDQIDVNCKLLSMQEGDLIRLSECNSECNSYIDLRISPKTCVNFSGISGILLSAKAETLVGSLSGVDCLCLDLFGPIPPIKHCWNPIRCTGIDASATAPIPANCTSIMQGIVLVNNLVDPPTYSGSIAFAFNRSDSSFFNNDAIFNSLREDDCIRLFDASDGFNGDFGFYTISTIIFDAATNFYVMNVLFNGSSSGVAPLSTPTCLQTYGPCCDAG